MLDILEELLGVCENMQKQASLAWASRENAKLLSSEGREVQVVITMAARRHTTLTMPVLAGTKEFQNCFRLYLSSLV